MKKNSKVTEGLIAKVKTLHGLGLKSNDIAGILPISNTTVKCIIKGGFTLDGYLNQIRKYSQVEKETPAEPVQTFIEVSTEPTIEDVLIKLEVIQQQLTYLRSKADEKRGFLR
jgi:hypothetical protein